MSKPVLAIFDDFFPDPERVFNSVAGGKFESYKSIWDGVTYPWINQALNPDLISFIGNRLSQIINEDIIVNACFARVMLDGIKAPHRIHSDKIMGQYSAHVYLSKLWPKESGTAFWTHKSEGHRHTDKTDCEIVEKDHDKLEQWTRDMVFLGKFNRAVLHDACLFHSAEPSVGWGDSAFNGRLVITTFFSEGK